VVSPVNVQASPWSAARSRRRFNRRRPPEKLNEMMYVGFAIGCLALAAAIGRFGAGRSRSPLFLAAMALLAAAAGAGIYTAATEQFGAFELFAGLIGVGIGLALAAAGYFLVRAVEEASLLVAPAAIGVSFALPIAAAVFLFNGLSSVTRYGALGLAAGAVAFALLIVGWRVRASGLPLNNRLLSTLLLLALVGFVFFGLLFFDAMAGSRAQDGPFLLTVFAVGGIALQILGYARRERFGASEILFGAAAGVPLFGGFLCLLLPLGGLPGWQIVGLAAFGATPAVALVFIGAFGERWRIPGYLGLAGLAAAAALLALG
jgi:hypothetical protein